MRLPNCELGTLNRSVEENYVAGGKGINMSVILKRLGFDNTATGFLADFSGNLQVSCVDAAIIIYFTVHLF